MAVFGWIAHNWSELANLILGGGVWFAVASLQRETKAQRTSNTIALTKNYTELWEYYCDRPHLWRVKNPAADIVKEPATEQEIGFVKMVIHHTYSAFQANENDLAIKPEGFRRDVYSFFSLPLPRAVWEKVRPLQNDDFVRFVESCLNWK
jgi:hypothetical protein